MKFVSVLGCWRFCSFFKKPGNKNWCQTKKKKRKKERRRKRKRETLVMCYARNLLAVFFILLHRVICDDLSSGFLDACKDGKSVIVNKLLANPVIAKKLEESQIVDKNGMTPIIYAAMGCHYQIVEDLLMAGGNPTLQSKNGSSPLSLASRSGRCPAVVELLLRAGVEPDLWKGPGGVNCLMLAAGYFPKEELGDFVRALAEQNLPPTKAISLFGAQLREGAGDSEKNAEGIKHLLFYNASLETKDSQGNTALIYAAMSGRLLAVRQLLAGGANPLTVGSGGYTAFRASILFGHTEVAKVLKDAHPAPFDVNAQKGPDGTSPLFLASTPEMATFLLSLGADPNSLDARGGVPLMSNPDPDIVQLLLQAGARVGVVDSEGATPLHWQRHSARAVEALLAAGGDPNAVDAAGETPLMRSASTEVTLTLLKAGALAGAVDKFGRGALARARSKEQVTALLGAGADVNAVDVDGRNAAFYAATPEVMEALVVEGKIDLTVKDRVGASALGYQASLEDPSPDVLHMLSNLLNETFDTRKLHPSSKRGGASQNNSPEKKKTKKKRKGPSSPQTPPKTEL